MAWVILIVLVVIFLTVIAPLMRQRSVVAARTRKLRGLQRERGTVVITIIHRQEQIGLFGVPLVRFIDIDDSEAVLRAIRLTPDSTPIDLVLHTPGGLVLAAEQIAHAVRDHPAKVTVFVPHYAMSGGTLLALAADEVVLAPHAVLGPLDPQVGNLPAASILEAVTRKETKDIDDQTLILADVAAKAQRQVQALVQRILAGNGWDAERAKALAEALTDGRWTHDYPITVDEARELGLPVSTAMPPEVYRFMQLFPQPGARRPSVEYVPAPYPAPSRTQPRRD